MELGEYARALRKSSLLICLIVLICTGIAVGLTAISKRSYTAQADTYVSTAPSLQGNNASSLAAASSFGLAAVKSYVELADSGLVLNPVISQLGLKLTLPQLAAKVTAQNPVSTVLLNITVTDSNAKRAADIANAVANQMSTVIENLETPKSGATSPVKITVTRAATVPTSPSSPRPVLNILLGIVVGIALGIAVAMVRFRTETSVGAEDIRTITGSSPLGSVSYSPDMAKTPLVALATRTPSAEAYRTVRTRLQFVDVDHPPRCFVVTSTLPSEGKTVSSCNLAITIANTGAKVCLVEADLRRPRLHTYLGIDGGLGLTNVLAGQRELDELLVDWNEGLLTVLPAGTAPPDPSEMLGSQHMRDLLEELRRRFDFVIIDAPALLPVTDAAALGQSVDGALLVIRHGYAKRDQLQRAVEILEQAKVRLLGTAITFATGPQAEYGYDFSDVTDRTARSSRNGDSSQVSTTAAHALNSDDGSAPGRRSRSRSERRSEAAAEELPRRARSVAGQKRMTRHAHAVLPDDRPAPPTVS